MCLVLSCYIYEVRLTLQTSMLLHGHVFQGQLLFQKLPRSTGHVPTRQVAQFWL